jgi:hypothetical protein
MTRKLTVAALIIAAALTLVAGGVAARAADSHPDPTGDANGLADISGVDVGNDYVSGAYVIWVDLANRSSLNDGEGIEVRVDTDLNSTTGGKDGSDYVIELAAARGCSVYHWEGQDFFLVPAPSLTCKFVDKSVRVEIQPTDLGGPKTMTFYVLTFAGEAEGDIAPNGDGWLFATIRTGKVPLSIGTATLAPSVPRAGHVVTAKLTVDREDTLERIDSGTVTCTLAVGSRRVAEIASGFVGDEAVCASKLPASARGKPYRLSITVGFGHSTITKTFIGTAR